MSEERMSTNQETAAELRAMADKLDPPAAKPKASPFRTYVYGKEIKQEERKIIDTPEPDCPDCGDTGWINVVDVYDVHRVFCTCPNKKNKISAVKPEPRMMRGPADSHPDGDHYGVHPETIYCAKGPEKIHCIPEPKEANPSEISVDTPKCEECGHPDHIGVACLVDTGMDMEPANHCQCKGTGKAPAPEPVKPRRIIGTEILNRTWIGDPKCKLINGVPYEVRELPAVETSPSENIPPIVREALGMAYQYFGALDAPAWILDNFSTLANGEIPPHEFAAFTPETSPEASDAELDRRKARAFDWIGNDPLVVNDDHYLIRIPRFTGDNQEPLGFLGSIEAEMQAVAEYDRKR